MASTLDTEACAPARARAIAALIGSAVVYVSAIVLLRFIAMPRPAKIVVALLPLPAFAFYLVRWIRAIHRLDELQRQIQLEALAIAYPLALLFVMLLGLLDTVDAVPAGALDYMKPWPIMFWLYFVGLLVARKRYR